MITMVVMVSVAVELEGVLAMFVTVVVVMGVIVAELIVTLMLMVLL